MKKLALITLIAATAGSSFAQGLIDWGNNFTGTARMPIYGIEPLSPSTSISGQSSLGIGPTGNTVYTGQLLTGSGYTFSIFAGASTAETDALTLLVSTGFRTGNGTSLPSGLVTGATIAVPGVTAGNIAKMQIRVWDNLGGTITTWQQALAKPEVAKGTSTTFLTGALGGLDSGGNIVANPSTIGWQSFNIYSVPEPGTIALAGLGVAALVAFRRRK